MLPWLIKNTMHTLSQHKLSTMTVQGFAVTKYAGFVYHHNITIMTTCTMYIIIIVSLITLSSCKILTWIA